jgi:hypothetical protein
VGKVSCPDASGSFSINQRAGKIIGRPGTEASRKGIEMNTIPELFDYLRLRPDPVMLQKVTDYQLAKIYVDERLPDLHVVKTKVKALSGGHDTHVGLYTTALSLDKRNLIAVSKLCAPQLVGRVFSYDNSKHPYCVWAMDSYLSAAAQLKALEFIGRTA